MGIGDGNHADIGINRHQQARRDALADFILAINIKEPSKQSDKRGFLDEG